jgi:VanZ family protein
VSGAGEGAAVATTGPVRRPGPPGVLVLLGLAVVVQLVVVYSPEGGGPPPFPQSDKVVHLLVFLLPVALAVVAGFRRRVVVAVFAVQAVLSEVVQAVFLPHRSGDVLDAVADLAGVALGVLVGTLVLRMLQSRAASRPTG